MRCPKCKYPMTYLPMQCVNSLEWKRGWHCPRCQYDMPSDGE